MSEVKKCPKCGGKMVEGSEQTLFDAFRCTRPDPKKLKERHGNKIQPYYCKKCGYTEFYRQVKGEEGFSMRVRVSALDKRSE